MSALPSPLILTAAFDEASRAIFQSLRDRHFPPELNVVPAHLTLFHHLPGDELHRIAADAMTALAGRSSLRFETAGVRFLGRGCALDIRCQALVEVRAALRANWSGLLTPQDAQSFRPHVTVQNKVAPDRARLLREELAFLPPIAGRFVGLDLWFYRGGPWEHAKRLSIAGAT